MSPTSEPTPPQQPPKQPSGPPSYPAPIKTILAAQEAGARAAAANQPLKSCPYTRDADGDDFLRRMWVRGYVAQQHLILEAGQPT